MPPRRGGRPLHPIYPHRADRIASDVKKLGTKVKDMDMEAWENEALGAPREMTAEEQGLMNELHAGTTEPDLLDMLLLADQARFYVLRREATLPLQGAAYKYPTFKKFENKDKGERADSRD